MPRYAKIVLDGLPFGDMEKDEFVKILKNFSEIYFVEALGFCVMSNHWHGVFRVFPDT